MRRTDPMWCHIQSWAHSSCPGAYWIPIANNKSQRRYSFFQFFIVLIFSLFHNFGTGHCQGLQLSHHIKHFEPALYDSSLLLGHHRLKRENSRSIPLEFTAHNREFKIRLERDNSIFADDVLIESTNGPVQFNLNKVYAGSLEDDHLAEVSGIINDDGIFDGHISTPNELYYIEPSTRYLRNAKFHSVIYKASDVIQPSTANCASQQLHTRGKVHNPWVEPGLFEAVSLAPEKFSSTKTHGVPSSPSHRLQAVNSRDKGAETDRIYFNNNLTKTNSGKLYSKRRKRSLIDSKKTTCMLYLQADHLFYEEEGSEEACIDKITRHVQRVNNIYKNTDFDRDGRPDNIGFMIKRIKIHNDNATRDPAYRFPGNYGVEKYLELFSEEDYDAFCLAYMFTYRDFEGGTLGLAWTGDLKNAGGVCEKNGHYRGSLKSLNTGIVTLLNYGKKVPPAVSHVTLAHEIGHNFGSPHDPEKDLRCTPGGENGNYIMFARATSGDKQNNNKFSPCSLKQINNVLNAKARDTKGCFTEPQRAICGNGVVEEGEECDCGWKEDCEESCCYPMVSNPKSKEKPCTLRPHKTCSPSQGPCCSHNCELKKFDQCREDNGCRDPAYCDGDSPYCPPSINKPNKTICKDEFVCFKGECTGSICLAYGLESCQCSRRLTDPETKSCELCCKLPGSNQPCISSFDWNTPPFNIPNMYAKPGTPCDNYRGYCDVFQKCREVDPSGPLATLRDILLSNESLANLQRWIIKHWYVVLLLLFTLLMLLAVFTKLCGRETKKKVSKRGKKGRRSKRVIVHKNGNDQFLTVVNGNDSSNHVVHPTVVRANLPFKRRVNEVKKAATKAKRVARSQLGRPYKKSSKRNSDPVTSPTDSDKSLGAVINSKSKSPTKLKKDPSKKDISKSHSKRDLTKDPSKKDLTKDPSKKDVTKKKVISSRLSVISFKSFRPRIIIKERKPKGKSSQRPKSSGVPRNSSSKDLKKIEQVKKSMRKNETKKVDKKAVSGSPEKSASKQSVPDKSKNRKKSVDKSKKPYEGNWLINKFLADEENQPKPILNGSLAGSVNSALNESPLLHHRSDSKRGLLNPNHISPIRGIVNAAFISSPRGARTHSSLRVGKPLVDNDFLAGALPKYRRSISMESHGYHPSPDKRKKSMGDGHFEKRKKLSSTSKSKSNSTEDRSLSLSSSLRDSPTGSPSSHESIQMESPDVNAVQNVTSGSKTEAERESLIVSKRDDTPTVILLENSDFLSPKTEKELKGKDWV